MIDVLNLPYNQNGYNQTDPGSIDYIKSCNRNNGYEIFLIDKLQDQCYFAGLEYEYLEHIARVSSIHVLVFNFCNKFY